MDLCTKCQAQPIVKNHMCEPCEVAHVEWLKEKSQPKLDGDEWYTLYETGVKKNDA